AALATVAGAPVLLAPAKPAATGTPTGPIATRPPSPPATPTAAAAPPVAPTAAAAPSAVPTPVRGARALDLGLTPAQEAQVEALLGSMTLRHKVGQMLMLGFTGTTADAAASRIRSYAPGSIIFLKNTVDPAQTARLTQGLQQMAAETGA